MIKELLSYIFFKSPDGLILTRRAIVHMQELGLTMDEVSDIFWRGQSVKKDLVIKQYPSCKIGMYYTRKNGNYLITTIWKKDR